MYTLELTWFELDLPDAATVKAEVGAPSPLFSNMRVGTLWRIALGRFEMRVALDAVNGLHDLSRRAFDARVPDLTADGLTVNGMPGVRYGNYEQDRSRTDWAFSLNGLTLTLTLQSVSGDRIAPTEAERRDHASIVASLRRVSRTD